MKIMQLNCWAGKLATQIKRLHDEVEPDIICIQEDYLTSVRPGSVFQSSYDLFPTSYYPHRVFGKVSSLRYMKELADFGNSIISKYPITAHKVVYTKGAPIDDLETLNNENDYNIRNFVHAKIDVHGSFIHVLTHHGHHEPDSKEGNDESARQLKIIAEYIAKLEGPVILTGDFNLHPDSPALQPITDRLENLCEKYKIVSTRSELAKRQEVIDYIFVSRDVKIVNFTVSEKIVSDHNALILEFDL